MTHNLIPPTPYQWHHLSPGVNNARFTFLSNTSYRALAVNLSVSMSGLVYQIIFARSPLNSDSINFIESMLPVAHTLFPLEMIYDCPNKYILLNVQRVDQSHNVWSSAIQSLGLLTNYDNRLTHQPKKSLATCRTPQLGNNNWTFKTRVGIKSSNRLILMEIFSCSNCTQQKVPCTKNAVSRIQNSICPRCIIKPKLAIYLSKCTL